jgi:hypothetical protein
MFYLLDEMGIWMPLLLRYFWIFTWSVLTPILVLTVIISSLVDRKPDNTEGQGAATRRLLARMTMPTFVLLILS